MNQNRIQKEGFSNPETEQLFYANWSDERIGQELGARKNCGFCQYQIFLFQGDSVLCLNPDSPYLYETVAWCFACAGQQPDCDEEECSASDSN